MLKNTPFGEKRYCGIFLLVLTNYWERDLIEWSFSWKEREGTKARDVSVSLSGLLMLLRIHS